MSELDKGEHFMVALEVVYIIRSMASICTFRAIRVMTEATAII